MKAPAMGELSAAETRPTTSPPDCARSNRGMNATESTASEKPDAMRLVNDVMYMLLSSQNWCANGNRRRWSHQLVFWFDRAAESAMRGKSWSVGRWRTEGKNAAPRWRG